MERKWNMLQRTNEVPSGVSKRCSAASPAPWVMVLHVELQPGLSAVPLLLLQPPALLLLLDLEGAQVKDMVKNTDSNQRILTNKNPIMSYHGETVLPRGSTWE